MVELDGDDLLAFIDLAFDRMLARADVLGSRVNDRPDLDGANSVFALVVHCVALTDWWLGHIALGHPSERDRHAEFTAAGTVTELHALVGELRARLPALVDQLARTPVPRSAPVEHLTAGERAWPWTTGAICLHVIEELFQHAGHVDITADLLTARG